MPLGEKPPNRTWDLAIILVGSMTRQVVGLVSLPYFSPASGTMLLPGSLVSLTLDLRRSTSEGEMSTLKGRTELRAMITTVITGEGKLVRAVQMTLRLLIYV